MFNLEQEILGNSELHTALGIYCKIMHTSKIWHGEWIKEEKKASLPPKDI